MNTHHSTEPARLGSNENLLGPSPMALKAIQETVSNAHIYATVEDKKLQEKLVARVGRGLTADQLVLGNGSGDVLRGIIQAHILPGDEIVIPTATFAIYKRAGSEHRANVIEIPLADDYQIDYDGLLAAVTPKTKLIFLCNPNNPTGLITTHTQMRSFLERCPNYVTVVVDEAYIDFADDPNFPDMMEFINEGFPVIVTRTFSKLYGLASLKAGYGFGNTERMAPVRERRHVHQSGLMMYAGASAALDDEEHVVNTLDMAQEGRAFIYKELDRLGLSYLPTQALFVLLTDVPLDAQLIVDEALEDNVILRHTHVFGMPGYVRFSIGRQQDNERGIAALERILKKHGVLK